MIAHHHLDSRRMLHILLLVWILLALLVLLPIRTSGQESLVQPMSNELVEQNPEISPEIFNAVALEVIFLCCASIAFLILNPYINEKPHVQKPKPAHR